MRFTAVTIFPELIFGALSRGVVGKAHEAGIIEIDCKDPRDFTGDTHRSVDDSPYGGGPGMVMQVGPLVSAVESVATEGCWRIALTPAGRPLTQARVRQLANYKHLVLVSGRYEGMDQRVCELAIDEEVSIGDFVLSGGELAAACMIDAISRHVPGVLGEAASLAEESFADGLVEYPQYTRPQSFRGLQVPSVLQSGDHAKIRQWRQKQALERTAKRRVDLWSAYHPTKADKTLIADSQIKLAERTYVALLHYPVLDREHNVVTSSVTTLDVHDIARAAATFGLAGYFVVSPVAAQRQKVDTTVRAWAEERQRARAGNSIDDRIGALSLVRSAESLDATIHEIETQHGMRPTIVATSASEAGAASKHSSLELWEQCVQDERPVLLMFGTGWGIARQALEIADVTLQPILGRTDFNHLSVRSAVAIFLDRLFGAAKSSKTPKR